MTRCPNCGTEIGGMYLHEGPPVRDEVLGGVRRSVVALCPACDTAVVGVRLYRNVVETAMSFTDREHRDAVRARLGLAVAGTLPPVIEPSPHCRCHPELKRKTTPRRKPPKPQEGGGE